MSKFEVRILASYSDVFQDQNLDRIDWVHISSKTITQHNHFKMSPENIYVVFPPNTFRAQSLNNNLVNISWDQDDQKDGIYQVCYATQDSVSWLDKCVNRYVSIFFILISN